MTRVRASTTCLSVIAYSISLASIQNFSYSVLSNNESSDNFSIPYGKMVVLNDSFLIIYVSIDALF